MNIWGDLPVCREPWQKELFLAPVVMSQAMSARSTGTKSEGQGKLALMLMVPVELKEVPLSGDSSWDQLHSG